MSQDPVKYKDPDVFNPGRFFDADKKLNSDDVAYIFGFGRRFVQHFICPRALIDSRIESVPVAIWLQQQ
jgi:hypothetical protein